MPLISVGDRLVVYSPLPEIRERRDEVAKVGEVTDIIATTLFHTKGIREAAKSYPDARLWGVTGFSDLYPDLKWYANPYSQSWDFGDELKALPIEGMPKVNELVLIHKPSRTLIVSDLVFNHLSPSGPIDWFFFTMFGNYNRFAVSKLFMSMVKDKPAFYRSVEKVLAEDFDRICLSHGFDIETNGKTLLRKALEERGLPELSTS